MMTSVRAHKRRTKSGVVSVRKHNRSLSNMTSAPSGSYVNHCSRCGRATMKKGLCSDCALTPREDKKVGSRFMLSGNRTFEIKNEPFFSGGQKFYSGHITTPRSKVGIPVTINANKLTAEIVPRNTLLGHDVDDKNSPIKNKKLVNIMKKQGFSIREAVSYQGYYDAEGNEKKKEKTWFEQQSPEYQARVRAEEDYGNTADTRYEKNLRGRKVLHSGHDADLVKETPTTREWVSRVTGEREREKLINGRWVTIR